MLKGEEEFDEGNEDRSMLEAAPQLIRIPVPVEYNLRIPIETFYFIITDECHRSIYNLWRQVLEYFDAFLIGLTATPTRQTIWRKQSTLASNSVFAGVPPVNLVVAIMHRSLPSTPERTGHHAQDGI